ncbi:MAG: phosphoribosylamine--glycine ligase [Oscillospiraceae bacterium]|nr:phosphoribosylamine--glycine ligase [Oscillospiraceae bacterium]
MKTLLIGSGGREHAIAWRLFHSPKVTRLFCAPGNGGMAEFGTCLPIAAVDVDKMVRWARDNGIEFAVVASDDPLAAGMVDAMESAGIPAFGPTKAAARIESSKIFAKNLMRKYGIPTAAYEAFEDCEKAVAYAHKQGASAEKPLVIKADGLALGKGALLPESIDAAEEILRDMMKNGRFEDSGRRVVIEEYMEGSEVTVLCFTDGRELVLMPPCRDHKRAFDGDRGPNTGGMGVISPVPDYTEQLQNQALEQIFIPTIRALEQEGCPFKGVLYFELMLTGAGPKVIEYNARFGDPEAQTVLMLLESDLMEIMLSVRSGQLAKTPVHWASKAAGCVVMASGGYPGRYQKGFDITGLQNLPEYVQAFHAGTSKENHGGFVTSGGRVLALSAVADTIDEALDFAYAGVKKVHFNGAFWRKDIGKS